MKLNKQILEAINNGIKLALDDFEDSEIQDQEPILSKKKIQNYDIGTDYGNMQIKKLCDEILLKFSYAESKELCDEVLNYYNFNKNIRYTVFTKLNLRRLIYHFIYNYNHIDLNWIDTSKITDMSYLFTGFQPIDIDISNWNISNVTNMDNMFDGCQYLTKYPKWYH